MRSIKGTLKAWNTSQDNPYVSYVYGVKIEGEQVPALFSTEADAMNGLMQTLIDEVLKNQDKDLVWREFPTVDAEVVKSPFDDSTTIWYKAYARWCFE
jgi:hypothetical protein